jgi:hypothetical protein
MGRIGFLKVKTLHDEGAGSPLSSGIAGKDPEKLDAQIG